MENVLLVILLILALALIAVVLLQRSEGGGLGIGGGGGGGGVMSARGAATALGRVTWGLGIAFLAMSLAMTIVSARNAADSSVIDRVEEAAPAEGDAAPATPALPTLDDLVPQADETAPGAAGETTGDAPVAPPRAD